MSKLYIVSLIALACVMSGLAWAEEMTFTTYYPAPAGVYNQMQANRMAVGDTDLDGQLTDADLPNRDGDIRLTPQADDPANWPSGTEGQFAYSSTDDALYHYNDSQWVTQEGGGAPGYFLQCGITCPTNTTRVGPALYGTAIGGIVAASGVVNAVCAACPGCPGGTYKVDCYKSTQLMAGSYQTPCGGVQLCGTYFAGGCLGLADNLGNCKAVAGCGPSVVNDISICK